MLSCNHAPMPVVTCSLLIGAIDPVRLSAVPNPVMSFTSGYSSVVPGMAEDDAMLVDEVRRKKQFEN